MLRVKTIKSYEKPANLLSGLMCYDKKS